MSERTVFIGVLVYIKKGNDYLMLHRVKKKDDMHEGYWVAPGGKRMPNESITDCAKREVLEETGLKVNTLRHIGFLHFPDDGQSPFKGEWVDFVFVCDDFEGQAYTECSEGSLKWVHEKDISHLPMWEGDALFTPYVLNETKFSAQLVYHSKKVHMSHIETIL